MLQANDSQIASQFKKRVTALTPVRRVVVFGSRARGDAERDSDLDIFVELPALTASLRQRILDIAWEISFENEVVISPFLATTPQLTTGPLAANPILQAIEREGVLI